MIRPVSCLLLCLALAACAREPSPEDQIRSIVAEAEAAAESRDASGLFELIAPDYQDGRGNAAEEIRRYLRGYLIAHQSIHLLTRVDEIEMLAPGLARLKATVAMLGREADTESSWDLAGDIYEFDVTLALEGDEWLVTRADWRRGLAN